MPGELLRWVVREIADRSDVLIPWAIGWARALPTVLLVPAFGMRWLAAPLRVVMGLALAVAVVPAVSPAESTLVWPALLVREAARGLPVAVVAATGLWVATMAGGVIDHLRDPRIVAREAELGGGATPLGMLLALLIAVAFLEGGGAAQVAEAISSNDVAIGAPLRAAALTLARGIGVAVAIAAPVVVAAIVLELVLSLMHRTAPIGSAGAMTAPVRPVVLLAVAAVALDRMAAVLADKALAF